MSISYDNCLVCTVIYTSVSCTVKMGHYHFLQLVPNIEIFQQFHFGAPGGHLAGGGVFQRFGLAGSEQVF